MNKLSVEILFNFIGRVITYVKRTTRNYPVIFDNVADGDILIYCVLTFTTIRDSRLIVPASSLSSNKHKVNLLFRLRRF